MAMTTVMATATLTLRLTSRLLTTPSQTTKER
jgi:hypothetical protein